MIIERRLDIDVVTAARQRIRNIFANRLPVYLAFSGGKDSLTLAHLTATMCEAGEIDPKQIIVQFIDEEGIFPCVEQIVKQWRAKFQLMGARFDWYCLEVRHFNCLNRLENDESFICWDRRKSDRWIRDPPPFAIRGHPKFKPRLDSYQEFLAKLCDGYRMTGLRAAESFHRRMAIAAQKPIASLSVRPTIEPIYDWTDDDVWRYLHENDIEIPAVYQHLWQIGVSRQQLRISQFFSVDTAHSLARVSEFYPGLMERILKREPAAYLVSLYWDSEMFRRHTRARREAEADKPKSYRPLVLALLGNIDGNFASQGQRELARDFQKLVLARPYIADRHYEEIYGALIAGDPKRRSYRAVISHIERTAADTFVPGNAALVIEPDAAPAGAVRKIGSSRAVKGELLQPEHRVAGQSGAA